MKDKKKTIMIIVLAVILMMVTVAYALLKTDVKIVGQAKIGDASWDIHFENLKLIKNNGSVNVLTADLQPTKFTLSLELEKPSDFVIYTFDVINAGTIDAAIQDVIVPDISIFTAQNLIYSFTYADGNNTEIKKGDTLTSGETKTLKLKVEYDASVEQLESDDVNSKELDLSASILYVQA